MKSAVRPSALGASPAVVPAEPIVGFSGSKDGVDFTEDGISNEYEDFTFSSYLNVLSRKSKKSVSASTELASIHCVSTIVIRSDRNRCEKSFII